MKESSLFVTSVNMQQRQEAILQNTKRSSLMGSHLIVTSVIISHLGGVCLLGMLRLYIKE